MCETKSFVVNHSLKYLLTEISRHDLEFSEKFASKLIRQSLHHSPSRIGLDQRLMQKLPPSLSQMITKGNGISMSPLNSMIKQLYKDKSVHERNDVLIIGDELIIVKLTYDSTVSRQKVIRDIADSEVNFLTVINIIRESYVRIGIEFCIN